MNQDRRKFLQLSSLGILATFIPNSVSAYGNELLSLPKAGKSIEEVKALASQAKALFYQKKYSQAEEIYKQCIGLKPHDIRFYDNLKSVYGAQGKSLEIIGLFQQGLVANAQTTAFYDRLARSLVQLELGNKKLAKIYKAEHGVSLLVKAKSLYQEAIAIENTDYLRIGLDKLERKITEVVKGIDYRSDKLYKSVKKQHAHENRKRYNDFSIEELQEELTKLEERKRTYLYSEKEQSNRDYNRCHESILILSVLVRKYKEQENYASAITYALQWNHLTVKEKDQEAIKQLRDLYTKTGDYQGWLSFRRDLVDKHPTFWNYMALGKALEQAYQQEGNASNLNEALTIYNDLLTPKWRATGELELTVLEKKAKVLAGLTSYVESKTLFKEILTTKKLHSSNRIIDIINGYVLVLIQSSELPLAKGVVCSIVIPSKVVEGVVLPQFVTSHITLAKKAKKPQQLPLYYSLCKVHELEGDSQKQREVLDDILEIDSENKFAKKRLSL